jgi:hypothetical protein
LLGFIFVSPFGEGPEQPLHGDTNEHSGLRCSGDEINSSTRYPGETH